MDKRKKNVFIFSNHDYSAQNSAAVSRIMCYSKAIALSNNKIHLMSFKYKKNLGLITEPLNNIYIVGEISNRRKSFLRHLNKIIYYFDSYHYLKTILNQIRSGDLTKPDSIIVFSLRLLDDILLIIFFKKILGVKIICEKNELFYTIVRNLSPPQQPFQRIIFYIQYPLKLSIYYINDLMVFFYDDVITISQNISNWVKKINPSTIYIPILYDDIKYHISDRRTSHFTIGYAGSLSIKKDGIDVLIESISFLIDKGEDITLNLYGTSNKSEIQIIRALITKLRLNSIITLHGSLERIKLLGNLHENELLVLPRPKSLQAKYGFSTKLADYFSTSIPVLATNVGENETYIHDGINGYLINDLTCQSLSTKIRSIIHTPKEERQKIGCQGYNTMKKFFHYSQYSKIISEIT